MEIIEKIGFVGGGRMAEAMIKGLLKAGLVAAESVFVADPDKGRREILNLEYGVHSHENTDILLERCNVLVLAVKPQIAVKVLKIMRPGVMNRHLIISIAAGIPLSLMEEALNGSGCRVVRVMPNTPALIQEGASALSPGSGTTREDMELAQMIFDAVGKSVVLDESLLDAVTGLSGSGPAYVFSFIEAMIDSGLRVGLSREVAETLVLQTVLGSVRLVIESGKHPAELRSMVTSPGGTTIAGVHKLEKAGFHGIIMDAIEAAADRSKELGDSSK